MSDLPLDAAGREALRHEYLRAELLAAPVRAARSHRSLKCNGDTSVDGQPQHSWMPGGCKNDGTGCLCFCHDKTSASAFPPGGAAAA